MTVILGGESVLFRPLPAAIALIEQNSRECMYRTGCPVFGSKLRPEGAVAFNTPLSRFGAKARIDHFRRSAEPSCRVLRVNIGSCPAQADARLSGDQERVLSPSGA